MIFRAFLHWLPMPPFKSNFKCLMFRAPQACSLRQLCCAWFFLRQSVPSLHFLSYHLVVAWRVSDFFRAKSLDFCHKLAAWFKVYLWATVDFQIKIFRCGRIPSDKVKVKLNSNNCATHSGGFSCLFFVWHEMCETYRTWRRHYLAWCFNFVHYKGRS